MDSARLRSSAEASTSYRTAAIPPQHMLHARTIFRKPRSPTAAASSVVETAANLRFPPTAAARNYCGKFRHHERSFCQPASSLRKAPLCARASFAATVQATEDSIQREGLPTLPRPRALPPPPQSSTLLGVLPYLCKLALSDAQLYWRLGVAVTLMIVSKGTGLVAPLFLKRAIDALGGGAITQAAVNASVVALLYSGVCRVVSTLAKEAQGPIFTPVSQAAGRRVSYHTFAHVLDLDIEFHLGRRTGALSRVLERGTRSVSFVFRTVVFTLLPTFVELILVCGLLARTFTPVVSLVVVATFAAYVAWTAALTKAAADVRRRVNALDNLTTGKAVDALLNYETVKLFNNEQLEVDNYDAYLVGYQKAAVATENVSAKLNAGQGVVLSTGLTAVLAIAAASTATGAFTAGDLVMAQGLLLQLWGPLQFLGWFYRELRQSLVDMDAFFGILQTRPKLPDGTRPLPQPASSSHGNGKAAAGGRNGKSISTRGMSVQLRDVHFGYTGEREVLKGVSLSVEPGQSCAIVGASGSGKSTLLRLLMRLYDPTSGQVVLDGMDVRDLQQASLRSVVAVVPQDTVLFNDTILANIAYGRPGSPHEEIIRAAELAQLDKAVLRMHEGYDTMVGERGLKLSGGEKQRVAIARAFLRQPRLLICDEATSALDTATEQGIMSSLERLAEGRTSLTVAHRLSTVQHCDKICVMANGVVVEEGTHSQLLRAGRVYADMWHAQAQAEQDTELCKPTHLPGAPVDLHLPELATSAMN